jgi:hypothetical protein
MFPGEWDDNDTQARKDDELLPQNPKYRLLEATQWMVDCALKGELVTLTWDDISSEFTNQPETLWTRSDAFPTYFQNCDINLSDPPDRSVFIFFESASFSKALGALTKSLKTRKLSIKAEHSCEAWLLEQFESGDRRTRDELGKLACEEFSGLSWRAFLRSWGKVAGRFGRDRPGRRSTSR